MAARRHVVSLLVAAGISLACACVGVWVLAWGERFSLWQTPQEPTGYDLLDGPCVQGVRVRTPVRLDAQPGLLLVDALQQGTTQGWPLPWRFERIDQPRWRWTELVDLPGRVLLVGAGWPFPLVRGALIPWTSPEVETKDVQTFEYDLFSGSVRRLGRFSRGDVRNPVLAGFSSARNRRMLVTTLGAVAIISPGKARSDTILPASLDPVGAVLDVLVWYAVVVAVRFAWRTTLAARRRRRGRCTRCGYNLAGLKTCPECGSGTGAAVKPMNQPTPAV